MGCKRQEFWSIGSATRFIDGFYVPSSVLFDDSLGLLLLLYFLQNPNGIRPFQAYLAFASSNGF